MSSTSRDNWERLVAAVLKREQIWQLCHAHSRSPSISTISSDSTSDFSEQIPNNSSKPVSVSPHPQVLLGELSLSLVSKPKGEKDEYLVDIPEDQRIHLQRVRIFSLHELRVATENFSDKNVLGHGYNMVYKGWLEDGTPVAVKRYKSPHAELSFRTELEINSIAMHPNILHVLGLCFSPKERLLVHPLMVNGSVVSWLWGRHVPQAPLHWPIRKRIALGAARGLAYLHYECDKKIIHRDVKASNILLDEDFEAVIADFEFAKLMECDDTEVTSTVSGTRGRIAPEYLAAGKCSEKADVFSYGIFLLELILGQRTFHLYRLAKDEDKKLLDWVKRNYKERKWEVMVGADCGGNYVGEIVELLMQIALLCTQYTPKGRPKMSEVVKMLEDGDGLAERWEEWYEKEAKKENDSSKNNPNLDIIYKKEDEKENDSLEDHPSSDSTIYDDTSNPAPEELSGPR